MDIPAGLIAQLSPAGAAALSGASGIGPCGILDLDGLADWDKVLLLARPEILGAGALHEFVDRVVGTGPCCADCAGKDGPAKRQEARSALNLLRRRLRRDRGTLDAGRAAAAVADLRAILGRAA